MDHAAVLRGPPATHDKQTVCTHCPRQIPLELLDNHCKTPTAHIQKLPTCPHGLSVPSRSSMFRGVGNVSRLVAPYLVVDYGSELGLEVRRGEISASSARGAHSSRMGVGARCGGGGGREASVSFKHLSMALDPSSQDGGELRSHVSSVSYGWVAAQLTLEDSGRRRHRGRNTRNPGDSLSSRLRMRTPFPLARILETPMSTLGQS